MHEHRTWHVAALGPDGMALRQLWLIAKDARQAMYMAVGLHAQALEVKESMIDVARVNEGEKILAPFPPGGVD